MSFNLKDGRNVVIIILIGLVIYFNYLNSIRDNHINLYQVKYKKVKDSLDKEIVILNKQMDSLLNVNDSLSILDSILSKKILQNKKEDNEIYNKIMGAGADSSYLIILDDIHIDSTIR